MRSKIIAPCIASLLVAMSLIANAQAQDPASSEQGKTRETSAGGAVFRVGGGVSAPKVTYGPNPEYSKKARKAKYQGTCVLWLVVGADGKPRDVKVARSLGLGLDEKAVEAVSKWRFDPARKDGQPVAVQINVEVTFRLY
jgi:periplasmic protein TonB